MNFLKIFYTFCLVNLHFHIFVQEELKLKTYDPTFTKYLNDVRITCLKKDTLQLHYLFGDTMFGMAGGALDGIDRSYDDDWSVFKGEFLLFDHPEKSKFWDFFLNISNEGFLYDTVFHTYSVPACNFWSVLYYEGMPIFSQYNKVFYTDTVTLWVGNDLKHSRPEIYIPEKAALFKTYPYKFERLNNGYFKCYENGRKIGYVASKELVSSALNFQFEKIKGRWMLLYYDIGTGDDYR